MHAIILLTALRLLLADPPEPCQITLSKTPAQPTYRYIGEQIRYDYAFTNTGTLALQGPFWIEDSRSLVRYPQPLPEWWLPGQVLHAFSEYAIVTDDMLRSELVTAAIVWGPCRSNTAWASIVNQRPGHAWRDLYMPVMIRPEVIP